MEFIDDTEVKCYLCGEPVTFNYGLLSKPICYHCVNEQYEEHDHANRQQGHREQVQYNKENFD